MRGENKAAVMGLGMHRVPYAENKRLPARDTIVKIRQPRRSGSSYRTVIHAGHDHFSLFPMESYLDLRRRAISISESGLAMEEEKRIPDYFSSSMSSCRGHRSSYASNAGMRVVLAILTYPKLVIGSKASKKGRSCCLQERSSPKSDRTTVRWERGMSYGHSNKRWRQVPRVLMQRV